MSRALTIKPIIAWSVLSVVLSACSSEGVSGLGAPALLEEPGSANAGPQGAQASPMTPGAIALSPGAPPPVIAAPPATAAAPLPPGIVVGATGATGAAESEDPSAPPDGSSEAEVPAPAKVEVNPFVSAAYDPLSTFAVDVDTASYDI